eukprot:TRINITY_DN276_c0_g1_i5.p2 TRINITY_DN276_c0_g1~~TRINITY_DN276_c0_g1_i5.p2  ORF type:complete len:510 (+),score=75.77 TRINITY_DN276_c0_g1_i5:144-1673(+)
MRMRRSVFMSLISVIRPHSILFLVFLPWSGAIFYGDEPKTNSTDNPCAVSLSLGECQTTPGCSWYAHKCVVRLAWLRFPSTSSAFGTTLAHHANASLPETARIAVEKGQLKDKSKRDRHNLVDESELTSDFFAEEYPVGVWFPDVFRRPENPGAPWPIEEKEFDVWKGFWTTMFRRPAERVHESYHLVSHGKQRLRDYARNVAGQQTSMLSKGEDALARIKCELQGGGGTRKSRRTCAGTVTPDLNLALKRLDEGFSFVGIYEEYDLSICLFHKMFRSECRAVEFEERRPVPIKQDNFAKKAEIAMLERDGDPWDTPLYEAAARRFWRDATLYNVSHLTCRETCPGVKAFTEDGEHADGPIFFGTGGLYSDYYGSVRVGVANGSSMGSGRGGGGGHFGIEDYVSSNDANSDNRGDYVYGARGKGRNAATEAGGKGRRNGDIDEDKGTHIGEEAKREKTQQKPVAKDDETAASASGEGKMMTIVLERAKGGKTQRKLLARDDETAASRHR